MSIEDRLRSLSAEIGAQQTELAILDEQIVFQSEVAEDARIRAVVSETPLADREAREAAGDLERLKRSREDVARRMAALRAEQDELLERLLEQNAQP